ncbi:MAG: cobalamin-dependent protein [Clostridiales Family XIII bacterium]|jgi:methanogenic corrinoid protein MtbC1|nr:cobalamin-dependent protein [Clostridiales Family XIII bacterium]
MVIDKKIQNGFLELSESTVLEEVTSLMAAGIPEEEIIRELQGGISAVGDAFGEGRMFVSDLMVSASIFRKAVNIIMPNRQSEALTGDKGTIVIGTVKEDVHNIGKDITSNLLRVAGYEVVDIGVDVPPPDFVKAVRKSGAKIVAMSCLLTSSYPFIINTIEVLKNAGLRGRVKIIVGGAPLDERAADYCGADAYGSNARAAVTFADTVYASRNNRTGSDL